MVETTKDPAVAWAEQLWEKLRSNFLETHKALIDVIGARAWEPLGYDSFTAAYEHYMKDISLAKLMVPHVVFQMIDEGLTADEIADLVKGIGPDGVEFLKRQKENGVSATHAKPRRTPRHHSPYATVFVLIPRDWKAAGVARGVKLDEIAYAAIESWFQGLS